VAGFSVPAALVGCSSGVIPVCGSEAMGAVRPAWGQPPPAVLLPLTVSEIKRLLAALTT